MRNYLGNKKIISLLPSILGLIPVHSIYWEIFSGSAQVLLAKVPAKLSGIVDMNDAMVQGVKNNYQGSLIAINGCGISKLNTLTGHGKETFIYCDPPYRLSERLSKSTRYPFEMSDSDHAKFLLTVLKLSCRVAISHYDSCFYDDFLTTWNKKVVNVSYHGQVVKEAIYYNYDLATQMAMPTFSGKDKTDRQRMKRKAERWAKNFQKLPIYEQQLIMSAIEQEKK